MTPIEIHLNSVLLYYRLTHKNRNAANRTGLELGLEPPLWCAKYQLHVINTRKYKLQGVMAKADNP